MRHLLASIVSFAAAILVNSPIALAETPKHVLGVDLLEEAITARSLYQDQVQNGRYVTVIDYRRPSGEPRFHVIDAQTNTAKTYLVAHGKGSDLDHDGYADEFSNIPNSKMTSLGAFVTGETYYGMHGLSLKLHGLETRNDKAEERLIVIHGASYVTPDREILGRSWGCPALEQAVAEDLIPMLAGGSFLYVVGQDTAGS